MTKPETTQSQESAYFDIQADFGITKHMGGLAATDELLAMCHLKAGQRLLEIGCGIGYSACHIAQTFNCHVTGVDLREQMVVRAQERAQKLGLGERVEFRTADAQELPFDEGSFNVVVDESVMAFVPDKEKAMGEYVRVAQPGGTVGLNEVTWVKLPDEKLVKYVKVIMAGADFRERAGWQALLEGSGLSDLEVRTYPFERRRQFREESRTLEKGEYGRAWQRFLTQSFKNPAYRHFMKEVLSSPGSLMRFTKFIGYGLYAGRKAE